MEHWLESTFEDEAGNAVAGGPYRPEVPAGESSKDWLRGGGQIRRSRLEEGREQQRSGA